MRPTPPRLNGRRRSNAPASAATRCDPDASGHGQSPSRAAPRNRITDSPEHSLTCPMKIAVHLMLAATTAANGKQSDILPRVNSTVASRTPSAPWGRLARRPARGLRCTGLGHRASSTIPRHLHTLCIVSAAKNARRTSSVPYGTLSRVHPAATPSAGDTRGRIRTRYVT